MGSYGSVYACRSMGGWMERQKDMIPHAHTHTRTHTAAITVLIPIITQRMRMIPHMHTNNATNEFCYK